MKVLVTGSNGLVGEAVTSLLLSKGYDIIGLNRHPVKEPRHGLAEIIADITSPSFLDRVSILSAPCQAVVHTAASLDIRPDSTIVSSTNCLGTHQVLELARRWSSRRFVFVSGVAVIGRPVHLPITEDHPVEPLTVYLASKLFGEHLVTMASRDGIPGVALRLTAPVGCHMPRTRLLAALVTRAIANQPLGVNGKGTRRQNYVDVRDVAAAVEQCLSSNAEGLFNIAGPRAISNAELADLCVRVLDSSSSILFTGQPDPDDDVAWEVSIEKAQRTFGYAPRHPIEDSIRDLADAYRTS
jgi:UDP-glucose 4-epimerase